MLSIPLGVITFITFNVRRISDQERMKLIAVSAIAGGALGNWTSRLEHGFVIDFLDFHFKRYFTYPAFNISDCAIVIGALLMGVLIIRDEGQKKIAGVHP
ncbi:MAG: hypothetical protein CL676_06905 [Bdellovibrionaceae bacterium]|nr:hypothetical protein [Pseudobdellovibrionaceae bacterium]